MVQGVSTQQLNIRISRRPSYSALSSWIAPATVIILLVYKIAVIGWHWRLTYTIEPKSSRPLGQ